MKKLFIHLVMNNWLGNNTITRHGWGNGYVNIPEGHPAYGKHYDDIDVDVHGGLTYAEQEGEYWVVGFDTAHYGDTLEKWSKEKVLEETVRLLEQLEKMQPERTPEEITQLFETVTPTNCICGKPAVNVGYCSRECYELDNFDGDSQHLE